MLNTEVIENFRKYISEETDIIYDYLLEYTGEEKNIHKWNVLCTCMDWIQVYVNVYNNIIKDEAIGNVDLRSGHCMYLVMVSDIIVSNINKLNSIFRLIPEGTDLFVKSKANNVEALLYFENDFKDDDSFFKKVRAIFGAHSHDINSSRGKLSCSWPSDEATFSDKKLDWTVLVYPTLKKESAFFFGFNINELNDFVNYKFNSLEKIAENIRSKLDVRKEG